jgi:alkylated DNA repair dioxygenase AlkB
MGNDLSWQPSLFGAEDIGFDPTFTGIGRRDLAEGAWVDHLPGWIMGADQLFRQLLDETPWAQKRIRMYERTLPEPRMTHRWYTGPAPPSSSVAAEGPADAAAGPPAVLLDMAAALSERYGVAFSQIGANLYRDGSDSVAWHGDRVARELPEAIVALISLGEPRPFRLRPKGGGPSISYLPDRGDLLVMGGSCQRTWDHSVPKVRSVGPRMSVQFRHVYDRPR